MPMNKLEDAIQPLLTAAADTKFDLVIHFLKDRSVFVELLAEAKNESTLLALDQMTSRVVMHGGTLRTDNRATLDAVSPFLARRILGAYNLPM